MTTRQPPNCRSRFARCLTLGLLAVASLSPFFAEQLVHGDESAETPLVHRIIVDGPINPAVNDYIEEAIERADADGAAALIIALDTPGGLLTSTKTIVKNILGSPVPVIVYVSPGAASATSAGVFITMSAHVAAMAPGTSIGAAHPVGGQGEDIGGDMRAKVENFTVSFVESIAEHRGRNVEWAEKAVRESVSVTETEAVELNVVDFVAKDIQEVLELAGGLEVDVDGNDVALGFESNGTVDAKVVDFPMTLRQRLLALIAHPNITYLLMMAGMLGLYIEITHPGVILPGVLGTICLLLALYAGQVLPINSTAVLLIGVGFMFFVAELFLPSFGVLGFGGLIAMGLGAFFLYETDSALEVARYLVFGTLGMMALVMFLLVGLVAKSRRRQVTTGKEGLVGEIGLAVEDVHTRGKVQVHGEYWNAVSDDPIRSGSTVEVVAVDGLSIKVRDKVRGKDEG